jgi:chromosome segregation ATPase
MVRGGLYKSDIKKARDSLVAQGKNPSVDAVRVALGNTGSKTTIHRYLRELDQEEGAGVGAKVAVSDALQDLIARLAARLHEEAETRIAEAQERFDARHKDDVAALERQKQENAALAAQLLHANEALQEEKAAHAQAEATLQASRVAVSQFEERVAGLAARITENEAHAASLEQKHQHAREALEHFRTSAKEQRDQEQRRHEHQVQTLQVEIRGLNETLTTKNHELLQVNREAGKLTEQMGQAAKDLRQAQSDGRLMLDELQTLRPLPAELRAAQAQWATQAQEAERLRTDAATRTAEMDRQRAAVHNSQTEVVRLQTRLETLQGMFDRLDAVRRAPSDKESAGPETPGQAPDG